MGTLHVMAPTDPVPEADRLEQGMPPAHDERGTRPLRSDVPDADALEQELPVAGGGEEVVGIDAERVEPVSEDDWLATRP